MNCHGGNDNNHNHNHNHSPLKHILHMILCCGLPIVIIGFLPLISKVNPGASTLLGRIAPFLCPIMMILMIPMMFLNNKKGNCCSNKDSEQCNEELPK